MGKHSVIVSVGVLLASMVISVPLGPAATADAGAPPLASTACDVSPPWSGGTSSIVEGGLHRIVPRRLLDTRYTLGLVAAGCTVVMDSSSVIPSDATAASLNVTAVGAETTGFVTVYPCDEPVPYVSSINTRSAIPVPNAVVVPLEESRRVCLYSSVSTHLIVDVDGWFGIDGEPFHGLAPSRILDSRYGPRPDGRTGQFAAGTTTRIPIAGIGPVPGLATGVALNLTATESAGPGFLTVYPCGTKPSLTSSLNFETGDTRANHVIAGLDATGAVCIFTPTTTSVILDVTGWYGDDTGSRLTTIRGTRVFDTRDGTGGAAAPIGAGETRAVDVGLRGSLAVGQNVVINLLATRSDGGGFLTVFPCGAVRSATSSLNLAQGQDVANLVTSPVGDDGQVCVYSSTSTDVVMDVVASIGAAGPLLDLAITGGVLTTPFAPDAHNYGVICHPGLNSWTLAANAVQGAVVTVSGIRPDDSVIVSPGEAVVVSVTPDGGSATDYWIRCLPADFPVMDTRRRDAVTPGWYLAAPVNSHYVVILDDHGGPVWYQDAGAGVIDAKLMPDGATLAWTRLLGAAYGTTPGGAYEVRTFDGTPIRQWATVDAITDHHELLSLANGNVVMISYHSRDGVDVRALGSGYVSPSKVVDTWLQEITPAGAVAWSWHSEDHVAVAETVAQQDNPGILQTPGSATPVLDLLHANSVDIDPATGDLIVSARHLDAVFKIRRAPGLAEDGKVLWKLGGNPPTDPATVDLEIVADPFGGPRRQHDARLLANGNITLFDNQSFHPGTSSRGVEYHLDVAAGTATLVGEWGRTDGQQAFGLGSTRRQPDGSTVVGWGGINELLSEFLPGHAARPAMVIRLPAAATNYRVVKLPSEALDESMLRATAGSP